LEERWGLREGFEVIAVKPHMTNVIDAITEIAFLLRPENGVGAPLTERDMARGALVSDFTAADYHAFAATYESFFAVRETATGRIAAFRWLYGPNDPADARDAGTKLIRELFGAVHVGKQIGVHPDYQGFGLGAALVNYTMSTLKADVYNVVLCENERSMTFHKKLGYEPLHTFTSKGNARTIFVKRIQGQAQRSSGSQ
jgi:GNAT superfamily N-acetyltransferase